MPRTALRVRRWAAIAVLGGLLAGCGTTDDASGTAEPAAGAGPSTSTEVRPIEAATRITDTKGVTVSLEKPPQKIVCLVALCDDILVELGMTPTATNSAVLASPGFLGKEKAAKVPLVPGGFLSPEVEAILSHRPDLVIGLEDTHGKLAPALKGATTFWPVQPGSWQDSVGYLRDLAALTGRTEEGRRPRRRSAPGWPAPSRPGATGPRSSSSAATRTSAWPPPRPTWRPDSSRRSPTTPGRAEESTAPTAWRRSSRGTSTSSSSRRSPSAHRTAGSPTSSPTTRSGHGSRR